jgi:hypothetical protein
VVLIEQATDVFMAPYLVKHRDNFSFSTVKRRKTEMEVARNWRRQHYEELHYASPNIVRVIKSSAM